MTSGEAKALASGSLLLLVLARFGLTKLIERRTRKWPKTSATIHSFEMETMDLDDKTKIMLPCFAFSYVAAGETCSGWFSLFTNGEEEGESVARKMVGRRIELQYDPKRPSASYIPEKRIEGFEVGQKMSPHLLEKLYPSD
jgi:hypothetical protein